MLLAEAGRLDGRMPEQASDTAVVPRLDGLKIPAAQITALLLGRWVLVEHTSDGQHLPIPLGAQGRVRSNCDHNQPGERRPTGGELGVILDVRWQWFWAIAPFLVSLIGGLLGGVASIYMAQQLGVLN
jgi:hypothetical protein